MRFDSRSKAAVFTVAGALVLCVGIVDALTGYEISVGFFYAAPVMLVTWHYGFWPGALLSIAAIVGMFIVDNFVTRHIPFPSNEFIPYWNTAIRLSYFILIVWLLSKLRSALNREQLYARRDFLTGLANGLLLMNGCGLRWTGPDDTGTRCPWLIWTVITSSKGTT